MFQIKQSCLLRHFCSAAFIHIPVQMLMCISLQLRKVKLDSELVFSLNLAVLNPLFNLERKTGLEYLSVPFIICWDLHHFLCHRLANERKIIFIVNCRRMLFHKLRQVSIQISREKLLEVADLPEQQLIRKLFILFSATDVFQQLEKIDSDVHCHHRIVQRMELIY